VGCESALGLDWRQDVKFELFFARVLHVPCVVVGCQLSREVGPFSSSLAPPFSPPSFTFFSKFYLWERQKLTA
jgi:hypothetical protein